MTNNEMMCCAHCSQLSFGVFHCNLAVKVNNMGYVGLWECNKL